MKAPTHYETEIRNNEPWPPMYFVLCRITQVSRFTRRTKDSSKVTCRRCLYCLNQMVKDKLTQ